VLSRDVERFAEALDGPRPPVQSPLDGSLRPWRQGETLTPGPDVLLLESTGLPCPVQVLLAAADGTDWVYHRGAGTLRRPLGQITRHTPEGLPYLAPEVVLLFKSRECRPKDHADLEAVVDHLDRAQRRWLAARLARPPDHPWLAALGVGPSDPPQGAR